MKYMYRPAAGGLSESMAYAKEFPDLESLLDYVAAQGIDETWGQMYSREDLVLGDWVKDDDRIGWKNCRYVVLTRYGLTQGRFAIGTMGEIPE